MICVCSCKDVKVGRFMPPVCIEAAEGEVERVLKVCFARSVADGVFPCSVVKDIEFYHIGTFDSLTGAILPRTPEFICSGVEFCEVKENKQNAEE